MKKLALITSLLMSIMVQAQTFNVDTIVYNGDINKRINIVILGDGYTSSQLTQFSSDATNITNALFATTPYQQYKPYFNVFTISVPSNASGADHPGTATDVTEPVFPTANVDTYFGSTFDYFNIHRLLVPVTTSNITNVLANNFPNYDQVIMLVNTPHYGGSGGSIATSSLNSSASEIAIHEIGHSFVNLIDEYYAGDVYAREGINMTQNTNPNTVRWKNWYGTNGIGIYQHSGSGNASQWYRPHQNCKMRYLGSPFCSVCVEGTIEQIHELASPIDGYSPSSTTVSGVIFPMSFEADIVSPTTNSLEIVWRMNGNGLAGGVDSVGVTEMMMLQGSNTLSLSVEDTTHFLRVDSHVYHHLYTVNWTINYGASGVEVTDINASVFELELFPNPTQDEINVVVTSEDAKDIQVQLLDLEGRIIENYFPRNGEVLTVDLRSVAKGYYIMKFEVNGQLIKTKKIVKN